MSLPATEEPYTTAACDGQLVAGGQFLKLCPKQEEAAIFYSVCPSSFIMDEKAVSCTTEESDDSLTDDEALDFTAVHKPIDFTTDVKAMDCTVDHKPMDLSTPDLPAPIDLSTLKSKTPDQEDSSKLPGSCQDLPLDVQEPLNLHSGTSLINKEFGLPPFSFEFKPRFLSSPVGNDVLSKDIGVLGARLASPVTSPIVYSPPLMQAPPPSPINSRESPLSPLRDSPGLDSSMDEQGASKRYSSSSRLFNILAKKYIGDIDCPPRPGQRPRFPKPSGETPRESLSKDDNESDAAYRERRSKNNLAARRSRDKRKIKCDLLLQKTADFKQETIEILNEIAAMQKGMLDRGFPQPLPYQEEINFIRGELALFN